MSTAARHLATSTVSGQTIDLTTARSSTYGAAYEEVVVTYLHAHVDVYIPAEEGGDYCHHAVCSHMHADTREGLAELHECRERLARIIQQDKRIPKWATFQ